MKMRIAQNPDMKSTVALFKEAVKRKTIVIAGNCWINYKGRASSKLKPGERIIIIKKDGALLVHRPIGYEPVNWMPGGEVIYHIETKTYDASQPENQQPSEHIFHSSHSKSGKSILSIRAVRQKPRETLQILFDSIYFFAALSLVDEGEFSLYASEEDMQEAIKIQPSLVEEGLRPITYEKKVEPGFIDVFGVDKNGRIVVIEIKRRKAGKEAVLQLSRYVDSLKGTVNRDIRGILVAPKIAKGVQKLLMALGLEFKQLDPKKCAEVLDKRKSRSLEDFY